MKRTIFQRLVVLTVLCVGTTALPAQQRPGCDTDSLYQLLDFWVGEWNVYDDQDVLAGQNRIEKILNGCAVMEHWTGSGGGEGKSLFYVDNDTREWRQVWVTGAARQPWGQKEKAMIYFRRDRMVIFQGQYLMAGRMQLDRTLLERVSPDEVKQTIQVSADGGQSWNTTFVGHYRRI
ncbi:MAG: hypothetical protein R3301_06515 [Saprospiraceae bacterium]|nr:hypothetical protein [Saprospiraceae bacterium]